MTVFVTLPTVVVEGIADADGRILLPGAVRVGPHPPRILLTNPGTDPHQIGTVTTLARLPGALFAAGDSIRAVTWTWHATAVVPGWSLEQAEQLSKDFVYHAEIHGTSQVVLERQITFYGHLTSVRLVPRPSGDHREWGPRTGEDSHYPPGALWTWDEPGTPGIPQ